MTAPRTRDLNAVIDALQTTEDELRYQVSRLTTKLNTMKDRGQEPDEYLTRLAKRYDEATGSIVTLRRYHEGRTGAISPKPDAETHPDMTDGVPTAYAGDDRK